MSRWDGDMDELDELFPDLEDRRLAAILTAVQAPEVTADPAFRSQLRRELMTEAWGRGERRRQGAGGGFWRALFAPNGLAWSGAVAGLLMVAVGIYAVTHGAGGDHTVLVTYNVNQFQPVAAVKPLEVTFSQPMDHPSTERAVQISPATDVKYDWAGNTLKISPVVGSFAPNTQYTVSITPNVAQTATGTPVSTTKPAVFTVAPTPTPVATPTPTPTPTATPVPGLANTRQLAAGPASGMTWLPDLTTVLYLSGDRLLMLNTASGDPRALVPAGVLGFTLSPDAKTIAYTTADGVYTAQADGSHPAQVARAAVRALGAANGRPPYATGASVFSATGQEFKLAKPLAPGTANGWFAPDGSKFLWADGKTLHLVDLTGGQDTAWPADATFLAWSPDSKQVLFQTADGQFTASPTGDSAQKLAAVPNVVAATWSVTFAPLLDAQQSLWVVDGNGPRKLGDGTFTGAVLAPAPSQAIAFLRSGALWTATVSELSVGSSRTVALDAASQAVTAFLKARTDGKPDQAQAYLTPSGVAAYASGSGAQLIRAGSPKLDRAFIVFSQQRGSEAYFVVRLVLATAEHKDVTQLDESLTVVRDNDQLKISGAVAGPLGSYAVGPSVIAVAQQSSDLVKVTFDSDLKPDTVAANVVLVDLGGHVVSSGATLQGRDVLVSVKNLDAANYRLAVRPGLKDRNGNAAAAQYDLQLFLPASAAAAPTPAPSPTPTARP
jgi:hypothetical protein